MKLLNYLIVILITISSTAFGQKVINQEIKMASEGKSNVYITRSGAGVLLNFRVYDGEKFISKIPSGNYVIYETEPGEHIFWAASENRDYVKANLEAGKTYVIDIEGKMGLVLAAVNLNPLDPTNKKDQTKFYRAIKNNSELAYESNSVDSEEKAENVAKAMSKYNELAAKNSSKIKTLSASQNFENANKPQK